MALAAVFLLAFGNHAGTTGKSAKAAVGFIVLLLGVAARNLFFEPAGADRPRPRGALALATWVVLLVNGLTSL